jgi:general secretion pathway protein A
MYESYFGLREMPFTVTPDPRFFYNNDRYEGTFSALRYGILWKKGLILLCGEVGTGKTTFLRKLMHEMEGTVQFGYVFYTYLSFDELVQLTMHDFGLTAKGPTRLETFRELNKYLVQKFNDRRIVALLIDEAQNLSDEALEGLRLLSNLEVNNEKVLQIVLVGQPELEDKLNKPSMRQLKDRIAIRCGLDSLTDTEIGNYVSHRLEIGGYQGPEIFSSEAIQSIAHYSRGKPRLINTLCDNALVLAFGMSTRKVSGDMIMNVAGDLGLEPNLKITKVKAPLNDPTRFGTNGGNNFKRDDRLEKVAFDIAKRPPVVTQGSTPQVARPLSNPRQPIVPADFFQTMNRALAQAMGPMATPVIADQIAALGESRDSFPVAKLGLLVDSVSRSILNETLKTDFKNFIHQQIYRDKRLTS